jgi:hypothetical protein
LEQMKKHSSNLQPHGKSFGLTIFIIMWDKQTTYFWHNWHLSGRQWSWSWILLASPLPICSYQCRMGSNHFSYSERQLWKWRLCHSVGLGNKICCQRGAHCKWHLLHHHDNTLCRFGFSSRLWKFRKMAAPRSHYDLLGIPVLYDCNQTAWPVASCNGSVYRFVYRICKCFASLFKLENNISRVQRLSSTRLCFLVWLDICLTYDKLERTWRTIKSARLNTTRLKAWKKIILAISLQPIQISAIFSLLL